MQRVFALISVDSNDADHVNVKIPGAMVRTPNGIRTNQRRDSNLDAA
jgi:hypothetical protein